MNITRGLPWVAVVLTSAATAAAQATVGEDPGGGGVPAQPGNNAIVQAARERRSISLSGESRGVANFVPEYHTVERGDTLWDITGYYFGNPWRWPSVWGLNPQITNPHWIFPNDQVRLLTQQAVRPSAPQATNLAQNRPSLPSRAAPGTQFFFDQGWLERNQSDVAGTIVGSPEDQMLLADGDQAYVDFPRRQPRVGEEFTIYQEGQQATGGDRSVGRVVRVLGTAVVQSWNRDRHIATVRITESLDSIERGDRMASISRHLEVVPPVTNTTETRATIVATIHPRTLVAQQMVVFLNRGADDGVHVGNRFFILRRGDAWRQSLTVDESVANQTGIDRDGDGVVDPPHRASTAERNLPEEVVGEVIVVETRARSCTGIVTHSTVEVNVGDVLGMRRGY